MISSLVLSMMSSSQTAQALEVVQALLDGPALASPPGLLPNFVNPTNSHKELVLAMSLSNTLPSLAVLMRMYTKRFVMRAVFIEDCESLLVFLYLSHGAGAADPKQTLSCLHGYNPLNLCHDF